MHTLGHEAVGNGYPIAPAMDNLGTGGPDIVVIAVEIDKACIAELTVFVVI